MKMGQLIVSIDIVYFAIINIIRGNYVAEIRRQFHVSYVHIYFYSFYSTCLSNKTVMKK